MKSNNLKDKMTLHPIMTLILLIGLTIVVSGFLSLIGMQAIQYKINPNTLEYSTELLKVDSLLSFSGLKYIFSSTVANFVAFTPLSSLIIILIGIGVMEKSGFLKKSLSLLTKRMKKNTVTFIIVFMSVVASFMGDLSYVIMIPISALIFQYGKRNPIIGIIASFAGLTCGSGLSFLITSIDSSLISTTILGAKVLDPGFRFATTSFLFIMFLSILVLSVTITIITEKYLINKLDKYEVPETDLEELKTTREEVRGLIFSAIAGVLYIVFFVYQIIPGLPLSGNLLDHSQTFYIDKLFSYNSFFSNGFVFVVTMFFVILGFFYGIGAKTIKNNKDFVDTLGHSLDGVGKALVLIFFASTFISIFQYTNIGNIIVAQLTNLITGLKFTGIPLIVLLFLITAISTFFVPSSLSKWSILAPTIVPTFMNAGITPQFTQLIYRFGECVTMGLTPLMAYFVIYLAMLDKFNPSEKPISLFKSLKYQISYSLICGGILLIILIVWYVIGLPIGIKGSSIL